MSKVGLIIDGTGVAKPIQLEGIGYVGATLNTITVNYNSGSTGTGTNTYIIQFINPDPSGNTSEFLRERFLDFVKQGLVSKTIVYLNDFIQTVTFTEVGQKQQTTTGQIISAVDLTTACSASPNINVILDKTGSGVPLIGTSISLASGNNPTGPVAAGTYALDYSSTQYFITVNSVSVISAIEICPLLLDYVFNLQNLGAGPVTSSDLDGLTFGWNLGTTDRNTWYSYYSIPTSPNPVTNPSQNDTCSTSSSNNRRVYGSENATWPVGTINNGNLDFSNFDVAIGIQLADSNVANWQNGTVYISFDFNANGGVVADSTFTPFVLSRDTNIAGSPTGGIPGYGDGTISVVANAASTTDTLYNMQTGRWFLPPVGQSLIGSANFTDGAYIQWDRNDANVDVVFTNTCNPVT